MKASMAFSLWRIAVGSFSVGVSVWLHELAGGSSVPVALWLVAIALNVTAAHLAVPLGIVASFLTQFLIHFGSASALFGAHCHEQHIHGLSLFMVASHLAATAMNWTLLLKAEAAIKNALSFITRALKLYEAHVLPELSYSQIWRDLLQIVSQHAYFFRGRAPPAF